MYRTLALQTVINTAGNSTSALTCAFPSNVTAGSLLVVAASWFNTQNPTRTITDTLGTTYTMVGTVLNPEGSSGLALYYGTAPSGGANTVSFASGTSLFKTMCVAEYPASSPALDTTSGTTGSTNASLSITPAADSELLVAICYQQAGSTVDLRAEKEWTLRQSVTTNASNATLYFADRIANGVTSYSHAWVPTTGTSAMRLAAFSGVTVGGGGVQSARNMAGGFAL